MSSVPPQVMANPEGTQRVCPQGTVTMLGGTSHHGQLWAWVCPGTHKVVDDEPDPAQFNHTTSEGPEERLPLRSGICRVWPALWHPHPALEEGLEHEPATPHLAGTKPGFPSIPS